MRREFEDVTIRIAAGLSVLALTTAACADTNPTSRPVAVAAGETVVVVSPIETGPPTSSDAEIEAAAPPSTVSVVTVPIVTVLPVADPPTADPSTADPSTADPSTADPSTADPSTADPTTPEPTTGEPPASDPPVSSDSVAAPEDGLAELITDDPTFDVEPLRPFEVAAAEEAAPVVAEIDDTGAVQPTGWAAFDLYLDDALIRNGNTAASVAVSIGGELVHAAAFGTRAPFISEEVTEPQDRFRIASISKPITAITLLRLVELGTLTLDDPVGQIVADHLGVVPSRGAAAVTVRRLLNHTTGFGKYDTQFFRKGSDDCNDAARTGMQRGAGGGGYTYSNMNFCVAGVLIEAVTGISYEAAAYEYVLTPLGLSGLRLANTFDPGPNEVLHPTTTGRNYMETLGAAGSWIATPTDLVTIMDSLDFSSPGFKPLQPLTTQLMKTPGNGQLGQRGYGLGLISYGPGRYGHTGTIEGTHAMAMNRGDGVTWSITVAGPYPDDTPFLESIINRAFEAAGFISG